MKKILIFFCILLCLPLLSCVRNNDNINYDKTVILHTNDIHTMLMQYNRIDEIKKMFENEGYEVILVDVGDFSDGVNNICTDNGKKVVEIMNVVGYKYITVGNHEFVFGTKNLINILNKAKFKTISSNILKKNNKKLFREYEVYKGRNGLKIGFVGLTAPETINAVLKTGLDGVSFLSGEELINDTQKVIDKLKNKTDLVILLSHLGMKEKSKPNRSIDLYENVDGVDFIIDGHTHIVQDKGDKDQQIASAGFYGNHIGVIEIDNENKTIEKNYIIEFKGEKKYYTELSAKINNILKKYDETYDEYLGDTNIEWINATKCEPNNKHSMGRFVTDAILWYAKKKLQLEYLCKDDFSIINVGGIREQLEKGKVYYKDIAKMLPFKNTLTIIKLKGNDINKILSRTGYSYNVDGKIDDDRTYNIVTTNFCVETLYEFIESNDYLDIKDFEVDVSEAVRDYIKEGLNGEIK